MKSWSVNNDTENHGKHEGKFLVLEQLTLKNKMYKFVTSKPKSECRDKFPKIVKQYKNATHGTSKMRPVDVQPVKFIDLDVNVNIKNSKI